MQTSYYTFIILIITNFYQTFKVDGCLENKEKVIELENIFLNQKSLGKGSYGKVIEYQEYAWKYMMIDKENIEMGAIDDLEMELKAMNIFKNNVNILRFYKNSCYYSEPQKQNSENNYFIIIFKMDKFQTDLSKLIKTEKYNSNKIWKIDTLIKISLILKEMHDEDYLHLDIKPENILFANDFTPILADLGFTMKITDERDSIVGSEPFISPEIEEDGDYSKAGDIYALAGLFYYVITDKNCIDSDMKENYVDFNNENESDFYKIFQPIIEKMIEFEKKDRPDIEKVIDFLYDKLNILIKDENLDLENYLELEKETLENDFSKTFLKYRNFYIKRNEEIANFYKNENKEKKLDVFITKFTEDVDILLI